MSEADILTELRNQLKRALEWAHEGDLKKDANGWSCVDSVRAAVEEGSVGLALTRWDDLLNTPSFPRLSLEAEQWEAPAVKERKAALAKKREAARLAFFLAELGLIDTPGGGEWRHRGWSPNDLLDSHEEGIKEADGLTDVELDELFP